MNNLLNFEEKKNQKNTTSHGWLSFGLAFLPKLRLHPSVSPLQKHKEIRESCEPHSHNCAFAMIIIGTSWFFSNTHNLLFVGITKRSRWWLGTIRFKKLPIPGHCFWRSTPQFSSASYSLPSMSSPLFTPLTPPPLGASYRLPPVHFSLYISISLSIYIFPHCNFFVSSHLSG